MNKKRNENDPFWPDSWVNEARIVVIILTTWCYVVSLWESVNESAIWVGSVMIFSNMILSCVTARGTTDKANEYLNTIFLISLCSFGILIISSTLMAIDFFIVVLLEKVLLTAVVATCTVLDCLSNLYLIVPGENSTLVLHKRRTPRDHQRKKGHK